MDDHSLDRAEEKPWLLLTYKVPAQPVRRRVAVWRKLKGLGAIYLQNGVCVLPKTDEHIRRLKVIESDIVDMGGEAILLQTASLDRAQEEKVVSRFAAERDEAYVEFISGCDAFEAEIERERAAGKFTFAEVEESEEDLAKLRTWLDKILRLDFFGAPLREEARTRLERCAAVLDNFAQEVFEAQEENRRAPTPSR